MGTLVKMAEKTQEKPSWRHCLERCKKKLVQAKRLKNRKSLLTTIRRPLRMQTRQLPRPSKPRLRPKKVIEEAKEDAKKEDSIEEEKNRLKKVEQAKKEKEDEAKKEVSK